MGVFIDLQHDFFMMIKVLKISNHYNALQMTLEGGGQNHSYTWSSIALKPQKDHNMNDFPCRKSCYYPHLYHTVVCSFGIHTAS